jgi:hypothetical protein
MDGVHDLGGRQGFGRVRYTLNAPAFHATWEVRANALYAHAVRRGVFNMDEYRHAIERMEPRHYLGAGYYERTLTSESPAYPFPDAHAHGIAAEDEPTYDVRFRSEDLWPNGADAAMVHVGVFQSYLERV